MNDDREHQELFKNIAQFVLDSRTLIDKGAMVEMAGLDKQVQGLCERVMELSDEDRIKYAGSLQWLLDELNTLGKELTVQREAIANEIRYLSSHKKANVAYKTADAKAELVDSKEGN